MADQPDIHFSLRPEALPQVLEDAQHTVAELRAFQTLTGRRIDHLEAILRAAQTALVPQDVPEPPGPGDDDLEANPPYQGWKPGDAITIQTMGGS